MTRVVTLLLALLLVLVALPAVAEEGEKREGEAQNQEEGSGKKEAGDQEQQGGKEKQKKEKQEGEKQKPAEQKVVEQKAAEQKVGGWFSEPAHRGYANIEPAARKAAETAAKAGVPEQILVDRLSEGAAKAVPAPVLSRALEKDTGHLVEVAGIIDRSLPGLPAGDRTERIREAALALRTGMAAETIERALAWSVKAGQDARRVTAALATVASLSKRVPLTSEEELGLAQALVRSREKPAAFGFLVSLLDAARLRGLDSRFIVSATVEALSRAGTFVAVEQALQRDARP